jgi:hypothetical protein
VHQCAWTAPGALVRSVRTTAPVRPTLRGRTARRTRTVDEAKLKRTTEPGAVNAWSVMQPPSNGPRASVQPAARMLRREDGNSNHYACRDSNGEHCHCQIVRQLLSRLRGRCAGKRCSRQGTHRNGIGPSRRCAPRFTQAGNFEARGPRTSHQLGSRFTFIQNMDSTARRTCPWRWSDRSRGTCPPHPVPTLFPFLWLPTHPTAEHRVGPAFFSADNPQMTESVKPPPVEGWGGTGVRSRFEV